MTVGKNRATRTDRAAGSSLKAIFILLAVVISGCGGGGGGSDSPAAVNNVTPSQSAQAQSPIVITSDNYGMANATYLSATTSSSGLVLRSAIATSMTDPEFRTVSRIDIPNPGAVAAGIVYSLGGATASAAAFPGTLYFFNGHPSTLLQTTGGTITFTAYGSNPGDTISGSFTAQILDGNDSATPKGSYTITVNFSYKNGSFGPATPALAPVPLVASSLYSANCASCHALGGLVTTQGAGPDLALKGGKLNMLFTAGVAGHKGITLAENEIAALKILLNVN